LQTELQTKIVTAGSGAVAFLIVEEPWRHPERSRFSGEARDLPRIDTRVSTKLHHYLVAAPA
jgi:hypothetical protein